MMIQNLTHCHVNGDALDRINPTEYGVQYMIITQMKRKKKNLNLKINQNQKTIADEMN